MIPSITLKFFKFQISNFKLKRTKWAIMVTPAGDITNQIITELKKIHNLINLHKECVTKSFPSLLLFLLSISVSFGLCLDGVGIWEKKYICNDCTFVLIFCWKIVQFYISFYSLFPFQKRFSSKLYVLFGFLQLPFFSNSIVSTPFLIFF